MALTYKVERLPDETFELVGDDEYTISASLEATYQVIVTDPEDPDFDGRRVDAVDIIDAEDSVTEAMLPQVNRTVYTTASGKVSPFVLCKKKRAKRDPAAWNVFKVSTSWKNIVAGNLGGGAPAPADPPDELTDITPQVKFELGEAERVIYIDKSETPKAILTPTKNFYAEPAVERIATQVWKISQYEESVTYDQLQSRRFKVNDNTFQGASRYDWLVENIEASEVEVVLAGGTTTAALVTYTIIQSPFLHGWKDDRALIDTHYLVSGKKIAFVDDSVAASTFGFIASDGTRKAPGTIVPDRIQFETFDDIDFSTFLHPSFFS
jgi:hypothetical protein